MGGFLEIIEQREGEVRAVIPRRVVVGREISIEGFLNTVARLCLGGVTRGYGYQLVTDIASFSVRTTLPSAEVKVTKPSRSLTL